MSKINVVDIPNSLGKPRGTYHEIQVRFAWHDQPFGLDLAQALIQIAVVLKSGHVAHLPSVQESQHVVGIPRGEKASLPFFAQESVEVGVSTVIQS